MNTTRSAYDTLRAKLRHIKAKGALSEGCADSHELNLDTFWETIDPAQITIFDPLAVTNSPSAATHASNSLLGWITTPPVPPLSSTSLQDHPKVPKDATGEIMSAASI